MTYIKVMLTLLVLATAALAFVMRPARQAPVDVIAPSNFEGALSRRIDSLEIKDMPAEAVVRILREKTGVNINIYWDSFEKLSAGPPPFLRTERINLSLADVSLSEALKCLFSCNIDHSFFARGIGDTVEVFGNTWSGFQLTTAVYDVSDLISDDYWGVKTPAGREDEVRSARMQDLISTIANCDWVSSVGGGAIDQTAGRLIVRETELGQKRVKQTLTWLRRLQ